MTAPIRLAVIGLGKIAREQHLPAIATSPSFELAAVVNPEGGGVSGLPFFRDIRALVASGLPVDAVALCTPPQVRRSIAAVAIAQGWHTLLEKPPGATLSEVIALRDQAAASGVSLFAAWHSRFADGVEPARAWLADRTIGRVAITWREDVRVWHRGQDWIWAPGGLGVFDPGINALSIATRILPRPFFVDAAQIDIPANRATPIAARVRFRDSTETEIAMDLDFRQAGVETWAIEVETDAGLLRLTEGGAMLLIAGAEHMPPPDRLKGEYASLYHHFAKLIRAGVSDVDLGPLRMVADVFLSARVNTVEEFVE